jgi:hypothetical protein
MRGILVSWDIDSPDFEFLPKDAPSLDAKIVVKFSSLKAVFFIRKASRFSGNRLFGNRAPAGGRPVEIIFEDGELLAGYMIGESSELSKRFYFVPKEPGEIGLVLIERSTVQHIFMREPFEKTTRDFRGLFRGFIGRIGL